jgi:hypothetical protein
MSERQAKWLLAVVVGATCTAMAIAVALGSPTAGDLFTLLLPLSFLATGSMVTVRQPHNLEAWLLTLTGTAWAAALLTPFDGSWVVPVCLMSIHLPLRFPAGRLPSARWRAFFWLAVVLTVVLPVVVTTGSKVTAENDPNPYYVQGTEPLAILLVLLPISMIVSAVSVGVRYRRSDSLERHQVRWIAWAGGWIVTVYSLTLGVSLAYDSLSNVDSRNANWFTSYPWWLSSLQLLALASFLLIPASFAVAILRYRLYDIDRIISRTLSYALVSGSLVVVYVAVVGVVSQLLPELDSLGVAVATLTAAAAFRPIHSRIQNGVDRRFNRSRYDSLLVTSAFSARVNNAVNPQVVADELWERVRLSLEPSTLGLWLRDPPPPSPPDGSSSRTTT